VLNLSACNGSSHTHTHTHTAEVTLKLASLHNCTLTVVIIFSIYYNTTEEGIKMLASVNYSCVDHAIRFLINSCNYSV